MLSSATIARRKPRQDDLAGSRWTLARPGRRVRRPVPAAVVPQGHRVQRDVRVVLGGPGQERGQVSALPPGLC